MAAKKEKKKKSKSPDLEINFLSPTKDILKTIDYVALENINAMMGTGDRCAGHAVRFVYCRDVLGNAKKTFALLKLPSKSDKDPHYWLMHAVTARVAKGECPIKDRAQDIVFGKLLKSSVALANSFPKGTTDKSIRILTVEECAKIYLLKKHCEEMRAKVGGFLRSIRPYCTITTWNKLQQEVCMHTSYSLNPNKIKTPLLSSEFGKDNAFLTLTKILNAENSRTTNKEQSDKAADKTADKAADKTAAKPAKPATKKASSIPPCCAAPRKIIRTGKLESAQSTTAKNRLKTRAKTKTKIK